jgi:hypothetical protein
LATSIWAERHGHPVDDRWPSQCARSSECVGHMVPVIFLVLPVTILFAL